MVFITWPHRVNSTLVDIDRENRPGSEHLLALDHKGAYHNHQHEPTDLGVYVLGTSRIMVAVSSPWASQKLTEPILDLARRLEAEVVVAHVAKLHETDETEADAKERGEQTLKMLTQAILDSGLEAQCFMLFSDDVDIAIVNTAKARDCTVIVLGLTGKGVLKRLIDGDVPGNIIRQAGIPVLLCPSTWSGRI